MTTRLAYENCGNCVHSNRPFGDEKASEKFDFNKLACTKFNHLILANGWCDNFDLSPVIAAASLIGASRTVDMGLRRGKSYEGTHQS